jgi:Ni/Co efflux regulator RcnB
MRTVLLAAVAAVMSLSAPAFAQDDYGVTLDQNGIHVQRDRRDYRDERYEDGYHRHHRHGCHTEVTRGWRNGHLITRKVTVCDEGYRGD